MSDSIPTPWQKTLHWLTAYAGFPARRLPAKAELLLLIATAAADDDLAVKNPQNGKIPFNANYNADPQLHRSTSPRAHQVRQQRENLSRFI